MADIQTVMLSISNGLLLTVSVLAALAMLRFVISEVKGWRDLWQRLWRLLDPKFNGGVYDLAWGISLILIGMAIRQQAAWEFRAFDLDLRLWQLALGTLTSAVGTLILIWVTAPIGRSRLYLWGTVAIAAAMMVVSYWLVAT